MAYADVIFHCLNCGKPLTKIELNNEIKFYGYLCHTCWRSWPTMYNPEVDVPQFVKQFVITVRRKAMQDISFASASPKSILKLVITTQDYLYDWTLSEAGSSTTRPAAEMRIPVIQAITGLPITSTKQLTQHYVSVLIDEVINVSKDYPATVPFIEGLLEKRVSESPWDLFPWEKPQATVLPDLQSTDPE